MSNAKMTLQLYHGRKSKDGKTLGWGAEGPVLEVDRVTMTYSTIVRILFTGQDDYGFLEEYCINELFFYDGMYYGDWSIQPLDTDSEQVVQKYDPKLAKEGMNETI